MSVFIPLELFSLQVHEKIPSKKEFQEALGKSESHFSFFTERNFQGANAHHGGGYDTPYPFHIDVFINGLRPTLRSPGFPF